VGGGRVRGVVLVWWVDLGIERAPVRHSRLALGPDELAVANGFRRAHDRDRYIVAHAALRTILGGYLGRAPAGLEFCYGSGGKPEVRETAVRFSMSRSHDLALCAVARVEVGVDVERAQGEAEPAWLRQLCPKAWWALAALPEPDRSAAFYRAWTRMEACVKAAGTTVDLGLASLETFLDRDDSRPRSYQVPRGSYWHCHDLTPPGGYFGALAVSEETTMRSTWWPGLGDVRQNIPGLARVYDSAQPTEGAGQ
jgi:4'-phosphopantetheinyl transferase